jgi:sorting nexin-1/2
LFSAVHSLITTLLEQLIELWETFLMQLDADEDGEPFFKPPVLTPAPNPLLSHQHQQQRQQEEGEQEEQAQDQGVPTVEPGGAGAVSDQAAAALATVEQEE